MIPKIIHYCWFGNNSKPKSFERCLLSWRKFCPDYQIIEHNETNYDISSCAYAREAYAAKKWAFVTDYVRLEVVYRMGGIYLDTDVELLKSLDEYLNFSGFMGFEDLHCVASGLGFGAEKGNKVIANMLEDYNKLHFIDENGIMDLVPCPKRNTKALVEKIGLSPDGTYQIIDDFVFLPREYMSPKDYVTGRIEYKTENTISVHHYDASWQTSRFKIKKKIFNILGEEKGKRIINLLKC